MTENIWSVEDYLPVYPFITDDKLEEKIWAKHEFHTIYSPFEGQIGVSLLPTQKFIRRLISPYTTYDGILLYHAMGTGKTCAAVAVVEYHKMYRKPALVIVKGPTTRQNFINELTRVCTSDIYIPKAYETPGEFKARQNKLISKYYSIRTFGAFANSLSEMSNAKIQSTFSNIMIIIDEVHNLRKQPEKTKAVLGARRTTTEYDEMYRLVSNAKNIKVLLLSGTPMYDKVEEIATVMNLILPSDNNMPTKGEFRSEFINADTHALINKNILAGYFRGRISFLESVPTQITRIDVGSRKYLNYTRINTCVISNFQKGVYTSVQEPSSIEEGEEPSETRKVFKVRTQVLNFVYQDGKYGKAGFRAHITQRGKDVNIYTFDDETRSTVRSNLQKLSCKFSTTIDIINSEPSELTFVYSEHSKASGAIVFACCLKALGYREALPTEDIFQNKGKRFVLLTGTSKQSYIKYVRDIITSDKNKKGDYCRVIVGSKFIGEGVSLKNVRKVMILDPHWNDSSTEQAINRAIRYGSLDAFESPNQRYVKVYRMASILTDKIPKLKELKKAETILKYIGSDVYMYYISEIKDIEIRQVRRLIKEVAIDCPFFRNIEGENYSKACDYQKCEYKCRYVRSLESPQIFDESSYRLYYADDNIKGITKELFVLYSIEDKYTLEELYEYIQVDIKLIIRTLMLLMENSFQFKNKYGVSMYLRNKNDVFYLSIGEKGYDGIEMDQFFIYDPLTFKDTIVAIEFSEVTEIIGKITSTNNRKIVNNLLNKIDNPEVIQHLIELSIIKVTIDPEESNTKAKMILDHYNDIITYDEATDTYSHSVTGQRREYIPSEKSTEFIESKVPSRKKVKTIQKVVQPSKEEEMREQRILEGIEKLKENKYGIYGVIEPNKKGDLKFKIADTLERGRKVKSGIVCEEGGWTKFKLIKVLQRLGVKPLSISRSITKRDMILGMINLKEFGSNIDEIKSMNLDDLKYIYSYHYKSKKDLCNLIRSVLEKKKLLIT